jgi:hypothetical protein
MEFADYEPVELARIFDRICQKNNYVVPGAGRARLLAALDWLYDRRDEHFGNGRLVRNLFENAIRALADRIAGISPVTHELLTRLEPTDLKLAVVPSQVLEDAECHMRFRVLCPGCQRASDVPARYLGRQVSCRRCQTHFTADWGAPVAVGAEGEGDGDREGAVPDLEERDS